jgi:uncharacterized protein YhaN
MKLSCLRLERYGMFTDRSITFVPDVRLHVIFGPNASGKTTALAAVTDLLYGIEEKRTKDDQDRRTFNCLHPKDEVRIGADLTRSEGERLEFRRRYGRKNTIIDAEDRPLPDGVLDPWLAGVSRSVFEHTFGLSQEGLRAGGDAMLQADGEIGRSLFAAASGLTGLADLGHRLRADAEAIFKPSSRGSTPFDKLRAQYDAARKAIRERTVTYEAWRELTERIEALENRSDELKRRRTEIEAERHRLARVRRVGPTLSAIDRIRDAIASHADLPDLPDGFDDRIRACLADITDIEREQREIESGLVDADGRLAGIRLQPELLAAGTRIDLLVEGLQALRDAARDLPQQETEYQVAEALLSGHARRLGLADTDALLAMEPSDADRARVRRLIADTAKLKSAATALRKQRDVAAADIAMAETKKSATDANRDPEPLRRRLVALRPEVEAVAGRIELSATLERRRAMLAQRAARLMPPVAFERLMDIPLPSADLIRRCGGELSELEKHATDLAARRKALMAEISSEEQARAGLGATAALPTAEAVSAVRIDRDRLWGEARRFVLPDNPSELDPAGRTALAQEVDRSIQAADQIADRRDAESGRLARHAEITRRLENAETEKQALAVAETDLESRRAKHEADWQALWSTAGVVPGAPSDMANWLGGVTGLIGDCEAFDAEVAKLEALAGREEALRPALEALGDELDVRVRGRSPALAMREIEAAIATLAECWQARRDAARDIEKGRNALAGLVEAERELSQEAERWQTAWRDAMPAIGLTPDAGEEEAEAALAVWSDVPAARTKRATARHRADQMTQTLEGSRADVSALVDRIAPDLATADHIAAIATLRDRLGEARAAETAGRQIGQERERLAARLDAVERKRITLQTERETLAALAGVADNGDLAAAADRITARAACRSELQRLTTALIEQADGFGEDALRRECAALPPDALAARFREIEDEDGAMVDELGKTRADSEIALRQRDELERGRGADSSAQDEATATAGLVALGRDYARLEAACLLVTLAIERHRSRYQDPLIARASHLFSALTDGHFARLALDYRDGDVLTLVAERADRSRVSIAGLSEGTRDQLYLALRLAALGEFATRADPLPFVCDDLLVSFDDRRAASALEVLAEAGAELQVILFTHHRHVVDLAGSRLKHLVNVIEL